MRKYILLMIIFVFMFLFGNCNYLNNPFLESTNKETGAKHIDQATPPPFTPTPPVPEFISVWNTAYNSNPNRIELPLQYNGSYFFTVDWGDGNSNVITYYNDPSTVHNYTNPGIYTVTIKGTIRGFSFGNSLNFNSIIEIRRWGPLNLGNNGQYFSRCHNLRITATDILDLTGTTDMSRAFFDCYSITTIPSINRWNVSTVTNMESMFQSASSFSQSLTGWNVSNVTNMRGMFAYASSFNGEIWNWIVSNVTDMTNMFFYASSFTQSITFWNVGRVTSMASMFGYASSFNQDIGGWNVSQVRDMSSMFAVSAFNQDIGGWNISNVTSMIGMFTGVTLSTSNYDNILIGWSRRTIPARITFDAGNSRYSTVSAGAKAVLLSAPNNWAINDGGYVP